MLDKAYENWKNFCDKADEDVKSFDGKKHELCPCCGHVAEARWDYDGDYDAWFIIECTNCSCRVKTSSWETCLDEWEGHRKNCIEASN